MFISISMFRQLRCMRFHAFSFYQPFTRSCTYIKTTNKATVSKLYTNTKSQNNTNNATINSINTCRNWQPIGSASNSGTWTVQILCIYTWVDTRVYTCIHNVYTWHELCQRMSQLSEANAIDKDTLYILFYTYFLFDYILELLHCISHLQRQAPYNESEE